MKHALGCTTRPYSKLSFAEACERIAAAGYTDVAIFSNAGQVPVRSDSTNEEITATKKAAADAGIAPSMLIGRTQLQLGLEAAIADYKVLIDKAAAAGVVWLLDCGTGNEENFENYYALMRAAAPHAQSAGVSITLKPHGGITLTDADLVRAYNEVNHPAFGICYDPGNIIYYTKGKHRPETGIAEIAPIVTTAIIKDCSIQDGKPDVAITAGEGLVDFEKVLCGLVEGGFTGPLYVECVGGTTPEEIDTNVRKTLTFVSDILSS